MFDSERCAATILFNPEVIGVQIIEAMNIVLHEYDMALAAQFENFKGHFERVVTQAIVLCDHELAGRQFLKHCVWS